MYVCRNPCNAINCTSVHLWKNFCITRQLVALSPPAYFLSFLYIFASQTTTAAAPPVCVPVPSNPFVALKISCNQKFCSCKGWAEKPIYFHRVGDCWQYPSPFLQDVQLAQPKNLWINQTIHIFLKWNGIVLFTVICPFHYRSTSDSNCRKVDHLTFLASLQSIVILYF